MRCNGAEPILDAKESAREAVAVFLLVFQVVSVAVIWTDILLGPPCASTAIFQGTKAWMLWRICAWSWCMTG